MKVLSVCGISNSGKTTTVEKIITELTARGYRVGSVKEIHFETFAIDPDPQSNTRRHRAAGARLVCARGTNETDLLFDEMLPVHKIIEFYEKDYDWVVMEGVSDVCVPAIVTAHGEEDLAEKWNDMTFCVSGRISSRIKEYRGVPAIDATADVKRIVDLVELKVYDRLPNFPPACCAACNMDSCIDFARAVLAGKRKRSDCIADRGVELLINGRRINMVPFVQNLLRNAALGVISELDGYIPGCKIDIKF